MKLEKKQIYCLERNEKKISRAFKEYFFPYAMRSHVNMDRLNELERAEDGKLSVEYDFSRIDNGNESHVKLCIYTGRSAYGYYFLSVETMVYYIGKVMDLENQDQDYGVIKAKVKDYLDKDMERFLRMFD